MSQKLSLLGSLEVCQPAFENIECSSSEADLYKNASIEFLNTLEVNQLDYDNFVQLKNSLLESNYYEDDNLEKFYGLSFENLSKLSSVDKISDNLAGDSCFDSIYHLLECYHFSDYVANVLDFLQLLDLKSAADKESLTSLSGAFLNEFSKMDEFKNIATNHSYTSSVVQIAEMNSFFSISSDTDVTSFSSMFDLNFAISGLILVVLALFFKLALAPFHLWSPDVYEGAPSSSTFFFYGVI